MQRSKRIKCLAVSAALLWAFSGFAQTDTVEVRIYGGQRDDRGLRLIEMANGDVVALSSSNSTTDEEPHAWVRRFNEEVNVVWDATVADAPLLQAQDVVEHGSGLLTILGTRYANASAAYDWGWYTVDANGVQTAESHWGTESWDLPSRVLHRNDSLWTLGTSYANGTGDLHCTLHTWTAGAWALASQWSVETAGEASVVDAEWFGSRLAVFAAMDGDDHAAFSVLDPLTGEADWTFATSFGVPTTAQAFSVQDSTAALLINAATDDGVRLGFVCLTLEGDTLLETIPGSGVNIEGRDIAWYGPENFATIAVTEELGLGGQEWLYSRWTSGGVWQGGPTFGSQWDEVPSAILHAADGRLWMLGATDGYSNGRDDAYLLVAPSPGVGNNETYFNEEVNIIENAVSIGDPIDPSSVTVFPNPARNEFTLSGVGNATKWNLVDALGRTVVSGQGAGGDASGLPGGTYWLVLESAPSPAVLTLQVATR